MNENSGDERLFAEQCMDFDNFPSFNILFTSVEPDSLVSRQAYMFPLLSTELPTNYIGELGHAASTGRMDGDAIPYQRATLT